MHTQYPKSFPNRQEQQFLTVILCDDSTFVATWKDWEKHTRFSEIDSALFQLVPLLYLRLKKHNIQGPHTDHIKGIYKLAWFQNQLLIDAIKAIIQSFDQAHIPLLILKGVPLLLDVYQDPGARFLGDGDILIDPTHATRALEILRTTGWKELTPESQKNPTVREAHFANKHDIEVDLHWALFRFDLLTNTEHPMTFERVQRDAVTINVQGVATRTLCPEDMLIHIIVHGAEANIQRPIRWVVDAISLIRKKSINWTTVLEKTQTYHAVIEMKIACDYLRAQYAAAIPASFLAALAKIDIPQKTIAQYYRRANTNPQNLFFGSVPILWNHYWRYQAKGTIFAKTYGFMTFLTTHWGLKNKRELIGFIANKYIQRIKKI